MKKKCGLFITSLLLAVSMLIALTACGSTYSSIKKAFEKEGYEESEEVSTAQASIVSAIFGEDYESVLTVHVLVLQDSSSLLSALTGVSIVVEFNSTDEMEEELQELTENSTIGNYIKNFVEDLQESDIVKGNCVLVYGFSNGLSIFKSTK